MKINSPQPFARGQGQPFQNGPFLGGEIYIIPASITAGSNTTFTHTLRVPPRHIEVVQPIANEFPSRLKIISSNSASVTVGFESAQSAGAKLFLW